MLLRRMLLRSTEWYLEQHIWSTEKLSHNRICDMCAGTPVRKVAGNHNFSSLVHQLDEPQVPSNSYFAGHLDTDLWPLDRLRLIFCKSSPRKHHVNLGFRTWYKGQVCWSMCILGKLGNKAMSFSRKCCPRSKCNWQRAKADFTNTVACLGGKKAGSCTPP